MPPADPRAPDDQPPRPPVGSAQDEDVPGRPSPGAAPLPLTDVHVIPPSPAPAPPAPQGWPGTPSADRAPRRRRTGVVVLSVVLAAVLVGSGLLLGRMIQVTRAWQDSSTGWEQLARTHGEELAAAQAQLESTSAELDSVRAQLATAQARITELADEKAQLGDTTEAQRQLADYQARVSQAAGNVATAMASCIDGQQQLIGYLDDPDRYDANDLAAFRRQVETLCDAATEANTQLQRELSR